MSAQGLLVNNTVGYMSVRHTASGAVGMETKDTQRQVLSAWRQKTLNQNAIPQSAPGGRLPLVQGTCVYVFVCVYLFICPSRQGTCVCIYLYLFAPREKALVIMYLFVFIYVFISPLRARHL